MTVKISQPKTTKILHLYFTGMPQPKIAQKCGVNQATVSRCAAKFQEEAAVQGIVAASKEHGIMDEVIALRSLATELYKSKATVEEAKSGVKMVKLFNSLAVPPEEYKVLAKTFTKLKDPGFYKVGMKLVKLGESTGKDYNDSVSEFEKLGEEIAVRQETIADLKVKQENEEKSLQELQLTRDKKESEVEEFLEKAEQKKAAAAAEVDAKLAEAGLTLERIDKLYPVVDKMKEFGISDDKLENFVKEHQVLEEKGVTWEKFQTIAGALAKAGDINWGNLAAKLEEYGTLDNVVISMKAEKTSLKPEVAKLGDEKVKLAAEVDGLVKSKTQLETEVGHLEGSKKALENTIDTLEIRRAHLEKHLAELEDDIAKVEANKAVLTEGADQKHGEITEMNEKLKEADAIDQKLKKQQIELQELDNKKAAAGKNFELYEAFKGAIASGTGPEIQAFLKSVPALIIDANSGKYKPEFMLSYIIGQLTGGAFDLLACQDCQAEFMMVKGGKKQVTSGISMINKFCPDCMGIHTVIKKKMLVPALRKVIVPPIEITMKESGKVTPEEKPKGQDNSK